MKKMFKRSIAKFAMLGILALSMTGMDAFARGSSRSSSSRSYSRSSKPSTTSKYTKTTKPKTSTTYTKSTTKKAKVAKKTSGGFGKKKVDTKSASYTKTNAAIKKDFGTSNKKYSSMKEAKSDLSGKMATKSYSYSSPAIAMSSRPVHIPMTYGGYQTSYYGGHYGWYVGSIFHPYTATHMVVSDAMVHSYAPSAYPVRASSGGTFFVILCGTLLLIGGVWFIIKSSK